MPVCFAKRCMKFTSRGFNGGIDSFAANILGARGQLLSVLIHFFEDGRWESPVQMGAEGRARGQNLLRARGILVSFPQSTARSRKRNPGQSTPPGSPLARG